MMCGILEWLHLTLLPEGRSHVAFIPIISSAPLSNFLQDGHSVNKFNNWIKIEIFIIEYL